MKLNLWLPKRKIRTSDPRKLWQVIEKSIVPPRTSDELEKIKREWLLKFDIANHLGLSDTALLNLAKEQFRRTCEQKKGLGAGTGEESWEKDCSEAQKAIYFSRILPQLESYDSKHVITGPAESILIAKLTNR